MSFYLQEYNSDIVLISVPIEQKLRVMSAVVKHQFYNKCPENFISVTVSKDEFSIIACKTILDDIDETVNITKTIGYRAIQLYEADSGVDHIGIAKKITGILADNGISLLYINTVLNNFILIENKFYKLAIDVLKKNKIFVCSSSNEECSTLQETPKIADDIKKDI